MLDAYYLREAPLPVDPTELARLIRMRQNITEVKTVLREFFVLTDDGWRHTRCDEEIERMQDKQAKARASAAASVNARKASAQRTLSERSTDVELPTPTPTPTPTPIKERERTPTGSRLPADWTLPDEWVEWAKQERKDLEPYATGRRFADYWYGIAGAKGRKVDWFATWRNWVRNEKAQPARQAQAMSFAQQDELARRKRWEEMTGRKWPTDGSDAIDVTPRTLEIEQ